MEIWLLNKYFANTKQRHKILIFMTKFNYQSSIQNIKQRYNILY